MLSSRFGGQCLGGIEVRPDLLDSRRTEADVIRFPSSEAHHQVDYLWLIPALGCSLQESFINQIVGAETLIAEQTVLDGYGSKYVGVAVVARATCLIGIPQDQEFSPRYFLLSPSDCSF